MFEVTVMNLLIEMKKVCYWGDAVELLEQFTDWDGLVSSQVCHFHNILKSQPRFPNDLFFNNSLALFYKFYRKLSNV